MRRSSVVGLVAVVCLASAAGAQGIEPTRFSFTQISGTTSCGGADLIVPASAPHAGAFFNGSGTKLKDLGLGCSYRGGGQNNTTPPNRIPPA